MDNTVGIFGSIVNFANYGSIATLGVDCAFRLYHFGPTVQSVGNTNIDKEKQPADPFYYMLTF